ncbi:MazG nucleotide pyrophosphohydrolase domain-containing protein [Brachybacterium kimchii]|uniref:Tetrapyrrole methyltransferase n=1 Tax=Brachybacterium kimchii TaxID=2942909 RepID=A0ABY4N8X5_9MICO|nr:MazG nucleotide pyrophosphohydrolase domain-containing protein [Brachybacterium kimchii]UQN31019.1 tetrapyrrole methyltransferase [Brachybacterium kimchii]
MSTDQPEDRGTARGSELLRAVAVMDALRAPDGDAWSALQTHHSLARYLLEETHEVLEAIEERTDGTGPSAAGHLPDELGDLLFQILFHARLGQEEDPAWDVDDVARAFVEKMERRNPHVFGADREDALGDRGDVEQIIAQWHAVKAQERAEEDGPHGSDAAGALPTAWFEGIPHALPALQAAAKSVHRSRSDGRIDELTAAAETAASAPDGEDWGADIALRLLDVVREAEARDVDPESALRTLLTRARDRSR